MGYHLGALVIEVAAGVDAVIMVSALLLPGPSFRSKVVADRNVRDFLISR